MKRILYILLILLIFSLLFFVDFSCRKRHLKETVDSIFDAFNEKNYLLAKYNIYREISFSTKDIDRLIPVINTKNFYEDTVISYIYLSIVCDLLGQTGESEQALLDSLKYYKLSGAFLEKRYIDDKTSLNEIILLKEKVKFDILNPSSVQP